MPPPGCHESHSNENTSAACSDFIEESGTSSVEAAEDDETFLVEGDGISKNSAYNKEESTVTSAPKEDDMLLLANLVQITVRETDSPEKDATSSGTGGFERDGGTQIGQAGMGSRRKRISSTSISAGESGLNEALYDNLTDEDRKHVQKVLDKGVQVDAIEAIHRILELILSVVILDRSTNRNEEIDKFDREQAKKKLGKFVDKFSPVQSCALDLLYSLQKLDKQSSNLHKSSFYLKNSGKELVTVLDDINYYIEEIKKIKTESNRVSKVFTSAVDSFQPSLDALKEVSKKHYGNKRFQLLRKTSQELKLGTIHLIVTDMNITMKKLATGKYNGHIFYERKEEDIDKYCYKPPPSKHKDAEDIVDGLTLESESDGDVENILEHVNSFVTLYLSSYIPEREAEDSSNNQMHSEDYVKYNTSLVTKLVSADDQVKKQLRAVYVHKKAKGVLNDYQRLMQDNGYLREELRSQKAANEELWKTNEDLRKELKLNQQRLEAATADQETYV